MYETFPNWDRHRLGRPLLVFYNVLFQGVETLLGYMVSIAHDDFPIPKLPLHDRVLARDRSSLHLGISHTHTTHTIAIVTWEHFQVSHDHFATIYIYIYMLRSAYGVFSLKDKKFIVKRYHKFFTPTNISETFYDSYDVDVEKC